jgi:tetratricopeptide (TPR) repeat protein
MFIVPEREQEWREKAAQALAQARALTPDAPDVLLEIGIMEARRRNWVAAARAFDELQTSYVRYGLSDDASGAQGVLLLAVGRPRDAIPALERARSEDPLAPAFAGFLSDAYLADGNITGALAEIDRGLRLEGLEAPLLNNGFVAALNLRDRTAIDARLAAIPSASPMARVSRRLLPFMDAPAGAAAEIRLLASSASAEEKALLAGWAASYREPELALQLLTDAVPRLGHPALVWQPLFEDVRRLPGFRDLARAWGFVDYWRLHGWSDFCRPAAGNEFICR